MLENLEPQRVFYYFEEISKIPRGSGNEKEISDYLVNFAKSNKLEYIQDEVLNVIIKKPATNGYENSPAVIIQGHIDMVCEKNNDKVHDFLNEPIKLIIDGNYITADGTTLGADNGIAIAYSLALLEANDISHPPIEAVFTVDEEVGMNGAFALDASKLSGKLLINIDSEEEGKLLVSCAGGAKLNLHLPIKYENVNPEKNPFIIKVRGLKGGHSGMEINKQRANANKLLGRILSELYNNFDIDLANINGGLKDNAIPREADATIFIKKADEKNIKEILQELEKVYKNEFKNSDSGIKLTFAEADKSQKIFTKETTNKIISVLILMPNGVQAMSLDIEGLVETSTNLGVVKTLDEEIIFSSAIRSSVGTKKEELKNQMKYLSELVQGNLTIKGEYPAWEYNENSKLREIFMKVYKNMYGKEAEIEAIHAGLECGLFAKKIENLDIISLGPDMQDVHTPDEKLNIQSTKRVWEYLKEVLKQLH